MKKRRVVRDVRRVVPAVRGGERGALLEGEEPRGLLLAEVEADAARAVGALVVVCGRPGGRGGTPAVEAARQVDGGGLTGGDALRRALPRGSLEQAPAARRLLGLLLGPLTVVDRLLRVGASERRSVLPLLSPALVRRRRRLRIRHRRRRTPQPSPPFPSPRSPRGNGTDRPDPTAAASDRPTPTGARNPRVVHPGPAHAQHAPVVAAHHRAKARSEAHVHDPHQTVLARGCRDGARASRRPRDVVQRLATRRRRADHDAAAVVHEERAVFGRRGEPPGEERLVVIFRGARVPADGGDAFRVLARGPELGPRPPGLIVPRKEEVRTARLPPPRRCTLTRPSFHPTASRDEGSE